MSEIDEFAAFDVRPVIDGGIKLDLTLPDGSPSGHWLKVRNFRCEQYRNALADISARIAEKGIPDADQKREDRLTLLATLIAEWSFKTKLSPKSARDFLKRAVLTCEQIDRVSVDDRRFFGNGSALSTPGPNAN